MKRMCWLLVAAATLVAACGSDPNRAGGKGGAGSTTSGAAGSAGVGARGGTGGASGGVGGAAGAAAGMGGSVVAGAGGGAGTAGTFDAGADAQSDGSAPMCGNDVVESGEQCDYLNGRLCVNCLHTACGACLASIGATESVCRTLAAADRPACETLWNCLSQNAFSCADSNRYPPGMNCPSNCYLSNHCVNEFHALAHTTDPTQVVNQMGDPTTPVGALWQRVANAACQKGAYGECAYLKVTTSMPGAPCEFDPPPVINEIDYQQPGGDGEEFVEIYNIHPAPFDFTGRKLLFFTWNGQSLDTTPYLTVTLSGTVPIGGYLVVASPSLQVAAGVQKIEFPAAANNIMNGPGAVCLPDTKNMIVWGVSADYASWGMTWDALGCSLRSPANPSDVPVDDAQTPRSLCRLPNGYNSDDIPTAETSSLVDWKTPCSTPTPGAPNVQ